MSQSFVQLNTDGTGKKMDTQVTTTAAQHRQVFVLGDQATDAAVGSAFTQPVSIAAAPGGASTSALQTPGNASLASIDTKTPALGQTVMATSQPVVIASNQTGVPVTGTFFQATQPVSAASLPLPAGAATSALQTTGNTSVGSIDTKTPSLGQAVMASSRPVVIASNQSSIPVSISDATSQSYCATSSAFVPGATPQDVFTLTGSGTKTISVRRMFISGVSSTGNIAAFYLRKRSTANSGGTSSTVTSVPRDSTNAAATAVARQYTANPTAGTLVGDVWAGYVSCPSAGVSSSGTAFGVVELAPNNPIVLRGTGEVLAVNFNGAALPAGTTILVTFEWVEA